MTPHPLADPAIREQIIAAPDRILDDADLMRAIAGAADRARGDNVIDLRAIAMARLEARLDRLEDIHRTVVAAAYENLAGMNMVHRAILALLAPDTFEDVLAALAGPVADALRVEAPVLLLETEAAPGGGPDPLPEALRLVAPGTLRALAGTAPDGGPNAVALQQVAPGDAALWGARGAAIRSQATLYLQFGAGRPPGLLALGSTDPRHFAPGQGTDLLTFFGGVFERTLRRFLG